jgi:hypothetical protein
MMSARYKLLHHSPTKMFELMTVTLTSEADQLIGFLCWIRTNRSQTHFLEISVVLKRWASVLYLTKIISDGPKIHKPTSQSTSSFEMESVDDPWLLDLDIDEYVIRESIGDRQDHVLMKDFRMKQTISSPKLSATGQCSLMNNAINTNALKNSLN